MRLIIKSFLNKILDSDEVKTLWPNQEGDTTEDEACLVQKQKWIRPIESQYVYKIV